LPLDLLESPVATAFPRAEPEPGLTSAGESAASLDRSLLTGLAWTGGVKWAAQALSWFVTLVMVRLLSPSDFGVMGMAMVYLGLVDLVNELGIISAIVQQSDLDRAQISRLGGLALLVGLALSLVSMALSSPVSAFFGEPAVEGILPVLSVMFVASALQVVPRAMLAKELRFRYLALVDGLESVIQSGINLGLAFLGLGYWALVVGAVTSRLATTGAVMVGRPHPLALPRPFRSIASSVTFGWHIVVSRVAWYVYSNADFAITGRVLGKSALGTYTLGWTIATIPVERVSALIGRVTPAVFARAQHDPAALQRYFRCLTEGIALISFPLSAGLAILADDFVLIALGERWRPAVMPLRLLACYGGFRSITTLPSQVLVATGHTRRNMHFNLLAAFFLPMLFLIGSRWGTGGVAMGWIVGYPVIAIPLFIRSTLRVIRMPPLAYLQALWPATTGTMLMGCAVLGSRLLLPPQWPLVLRFGIHVMVGALAYLAVLRTAHADRLSALRRVLRDVRGS